MNGKDRPAITPSDMRPTLGMDYKGLVDRMNRTLGVEYSFDMIQRELKYGGRRFAMYFMDGFVKDNIMNRIMEHLSLLPPESFRPDALAALLHTHIGYLEVETEGHVDKLADAVLSGQLVLVPEGEEHAVVIDARTYPARGPSEPDIERVVRGARDGFTETLIFNTALTRRRLRDPSLRMEYLQIGKRSKTDICLAYLADVADPTLVDTIRSKIKEIKIDGIPMADKTIEEFVFKHKWNPYPMVRYTERPDVAAVHLLEGHVLIYTDTSPSVMIAPTTFFHHVQHAEEYRQKPIVGAYLRWVRFIGMFSSLFLLPFWYLLVQNPDWFGGFWHRHFTQAGHAALPLLVQFLVVEIGIDMLRMAAIHTPSPLATALGLVSAIMLGSVAVKVGMFSDEVILYLAISAIGTYATPSYEMGLANRLTRLSLLLLIGCFGWAGFVFGVLFWFLLLARTKSFNTPYLWPLLPFNGKALADVLFRLPADINQGRPRNLNPRDPDRMPNGGGETGSQDAGARAEMQHSDERRKMKKRVGEAHSGEEREKRGDGTADENEK